jgi:hypothetical protein
VKKCLSILIGFLLLFCTQRGYTEELPTASQVLNTEKDYIVKVGDTLWDISRKFYSDPFLWPRLWQQNQYITNPHQIKPGDLIRLYPYKVLIEVQEEKKPTVKEVKPLAPPTLAEVPPPLPPLPEIIRLTIYPEVNSAGFIADKMEGIGRIVSAKLAKLQFVAEDEIYITLQKGFTAKKGDMFTIFRVGNPIIHPIIKKKVIGRKVMILGTVVITKIKEGETATALIIRSYDAMVRGDELAPYFAPIEGLPVSAMEKRQYGWVVASQRDKIELVEGDIVYLDCGEDDHLRPGHIFYVLRRGAIVADPVSQEKKAVIKLPDEIIARLIVIKTQPKTSTAVIIQTRLSVQVGDEITSVSE